MDITVTDMPDQDRYEATSFDGVIGFLAYQRNDGVIFLNHAEVNPAYRGRGIAGAMVQVAMQAARDRGDEVVAVCPYVRAWISRHPEWA